MPGLEGDIFLKKGLNSQIHSSSITTCRVSAGSGSGVDEDTSIPMLWMFVGYPQNGRIKLSRVLGWSKNRRIIISNIFNKTEKKTTDGWRGMSWWNVLRGLSACLLEGSGITQFSNISVMLSFRRTEARALSME
jgi:hypothetical protein